jgi:hypothetical protein
MKKQRRQAIRLPKGWKTRVRLAVLDVISQAQDSLTWAQGWAFSHRQHLYGSPCQEARTRSVDRLE